MRIAYDYQIFCLQAYGGVSRYFVNLASRVALYGHMARVFSPLHQNQYLKAASMLDTFGFHLHGYPPKSSSLFLLFNREVGSAAINKWKPSVVHETFYSQAPSSSTNCPVILTVYDMINERFPGDFSHKDQTNERKKNAVNRADHIICISNSTRQDLISMLSVPADKVSTVYLGFDRLSKDDAFCTTSNPIGRQFVLYVGSRSGYKNFSRFLCAFSGSSRLKNDFDIVTFGGGEFSIVEYDLIRKLGFKEGQVRHVFGGDDLLGTYYATATAFVYPSIYEGFGLPPLEAMAHDCPVISSNTSSMPEVIGNAAQYFDPENIDEMRYAIEEVVYSDSKIKELRSYGADRIKQFSWEKCTMETIAIYEKVI